MTEHSQNCSCSLSAQQADDLIRGTLELASVTADDTHHVAMTQRCIEGLRNERSVMQPDAQFAAFMPNRVANTTLAPVVPLQSKMDTTSFEQHGQDIGVDASESRTDHRRPGVAFAALAAAAALLVVLAIGQLRTSPIEPEEAPQVLDQPTLPDTGGDNEPPTSDATPPTSGDAGSADERADALIEADANTTAVSETTTDDGSTRDEDTVDNSGVASSPDAGEESASEPASGTDDASSGPDSESSTEPDSNRPETSGVDDGGDSGAAGDAAGSGSTEVAPTPPDNSDDNDPDGSSPSATDGSSTTSATPGSDQEIEPSDGATLRFCVVDYEQVDCSLIDGELPDLANFDVDAAAGTFQACLFDGVATSCADIDQNGATAEALDHGEHFDDYESLTSLLDELLTETEGLDLDQERPGAETDFDACFDQDGFWIDSEACNAAWDDFDAEGFDDDWDESDPEDFFEDEFFDDPDFFDEEDEFFDE